MSRNLLLAMVLLLSVSLALWTGCFGSEDNKGSDLGQATPPPGACESNTAPTLSGIKIFPNGGSASTSFMETSVADVYFTYDDPDCNVAKGEIYISLDGAAAEYYADIAGNAPCTATADDQAAGFSFMPSGEGDHTLSVYITDFCGAKSETVGIDFTLTPYVATDDDTAGDDDTSVEPMLLTGQIDYAGDSDLAGRPVALLLYTKWLPEQLAPAAYLLLTVPAEGFPFTYEWNLDEAGVEPGSYFLAAIADAVEGDGFFNRLADPVHSPYWPTILEAGQTTAANLTLVDPTKR